MWSGPRLEQFVKDCALWEGPTLEQGKSVRSKGASGRRCYGPTPAFIPCPALLLRREEVEELGVKE